MASASIDRKYLFKQGKGPYIGGKGPFNIDFMSKDGTIIGDFDAALNERGKPVVVLTKSGEVSGKTPLGEQAQKAVAAGSSYFNGQVPEIIATVPSDQVTSATQSLQSAKLSTNWRVMSLPDTSSKYSGLGGKLFKPG